MLLRRRPPSRGVAPAMSDTDDPSGHGRPKRSPILAQSCSVDRRALSAWMPGLRSTPTSELARNVQQPEAAFGAARRPRSRAGAGVWAVRWRSSWSSTLVQDSHRRRAQAGRGGAGGAAPAVDSERAEPRASPSPIRPTSRSSPPIELPELEGLPGKRPRGGDRLTRTVDKASSTSLQASATRRSWWRSSDGTEAENGHTCSRVDFVGRDRRRDLWTAAPGARASTAGARHRALHSRGSRSSWWAPTAGADVRGALLTFPTRTTRVETLAGREVGLRRARGQRHP